VGGGSQVDWVGYMELRVDNFCGAICTPGRGSLHAVPLNLLPLKAESPRVLR
jgi:hypothetical protein